MTGRSSCMWIVIFLLALSESANAQWTKTMPERGMVPGASFDGSSLGNVDMVNGNIVLHIPLTSLPAGAAGSGLDLVYTYNSAIYDNTSGYYVTYPIVPPAAGTPPAYSRLDRLNISPYATSLIYNLFNYGLILEVRDNPNLSCTFSTNPTDIFHIYPKEQVFSYRMRAVFPDGSLHTLFLEDNQQLGRYGVQDPGSDHGWYAYNPGLRRVEAPPVTRSVCLEVLNANETINGRPALPSITGPLTYYTNDGTHLRVTINTAAENGSSWETQEWTMYFPDGRKITGFSDAMNAIYDRNNNKITIAGKRSDCQNNPGQTCFKTTIADAYSKPAENHRVITVDHSNYAVTTISQKGANNEQLTWTISHGYVQTSFGYQCQSMGATQIIADWCQKTVNVPVVTQIDLPGFQCSGADCSLSYKFQYNDPIPAEYGTSFESHISAQGRLTDLLLPYSQPSAEAKIHFVYTGIPPYSRMMDNPIISKRLTFIDPQSNQKTDKLWSYRWGVDSDDCNTVQNPDGGTEYHYAYSPMHNPNKLAGRNYKISYPDGSQVENEWAFKEFDIDSNLYVKREVRSVAPVGAASSQTPDTSHMLSAVKYYEYDINGNMLRMDEYDWIKYNDISRSSGIIAWSAAGIGEPVRSTRMTYWADIGEGASANEYWRPTAPRLLNALQNKIVTANGMTLASSTYAYDDPLSKGNLTEESHADSDPNNASQLITRSYTYDSNGNLLSETGPNDVTSVFVYGDASIPYPTEMHEAFRTADQRDWDFKWNAQTGQRTSEVDKNNELATDVGYDARGRQISVILSVIKVTGEKEGIRGTYMEYDDSPSVPTVTVSKDLKLFGDKAVKTKTTADNRGLAWRTQTTDDDGALEISQHSYERISGGNTYKLASNPSRTSGEATMGWTRTRLDNMGRVVEISHFAGDSLPAPWGSNANSTGAAVTSYGTIYDPSLSKDLYTENITDEEGKTRIVTRDGLNRLVRVTEVGSETERTETYYTYDALDNLVGVNQSGQTRSFAYSSLGRLLRATNPESGTYCFGYDRAGNLITKTHATGNSCPPALNEGDFVSMAYDSLNRIKAKIYNDGTPEVGYQYGTVGIANSPDCPTKGTGFETNFAAGRLVSVSSSVSSYSYGCYDAQGRVLKSTQTTSGQDYGFYYHYLTGFMDWIKYPDGRTVTYTPGGRGLVKGVPGYADSISYTSSGLLQSLALGNGVTEKRDYNSRLQLESLVAAQGEVKKLSLKYAFNSGKNNGNPISQTIGYPASGPEASFSQTQTYAYDGYNRLRQFTEGSASRIYSYDVWGNQVVSDTGFPKADFMPAAYDSLNRIASPAAVYDSHGNQLTIGRMVMTYNGDDLQKTAQVSNGGSAAYEYDGQGRRVRKLFCSNSPTCTDSTPAVVKTTYVYDASGRLMSEDSSSGTSIGREYNTSDSLGSVRLVTDGQGNVLRRYDYIPFGEELPRDFNGRSSMYPVASGSFDNQSNKFTGKERDPETGLDHFGARYVSGVQGRFMSPDPSPDGVNPLDPQSWNLYSYVRNRPMRYIDIGGQWATEIHAQLLTAALQGYVSSGELQRLVNRQFIMDKNWNAPVNQYMHAMSNGLSKPPQSNAEATAKMWDFVSDDIREAKAGAHGWFGNFTDRSLVFLGDAIHTLQDYTSPVHRNDSGKALPWMGYDLNAVGHMAGENTPMRNWSRIGWAIRITMAAFMDVNPEQAAQNGLTPATFDREAQKRINKYINSFYSQYNGMLAFRPGEIDAARQCALGNPAACVK